MPGIISDLKTSIPDKQATAIERLTNVLYQIGLYQKQISELKFFHNELHNLETGLALIVNSIRNAVRQNESLRLYDIEDNWRMAVLPCMQAMRVFASEEMKFLREPRFKITPGGIGGSKWVIEGPQWVIDLVAFQIEFEHYFNGRNKKQDTKVISKVPGEMLDKCREHLLRIDRRLLEAINKLDEFSNQILQGVRNA